jgi:fucose 4-O-acetylase-like acetyltransferase
LDNARFILLAFVVVDHFSWPLLKNSETMTTLFYWLHLFHMPAFVMVTGFVSRSLVVNDAKARGLVTRVLVPYLIFQTLYQLADPLIRKQELVRWAPLTPAWLMWFLAAMLVWRLMTPYLLRIRWILPISVVVSLVAGAIGGVSHMLSLDRVLSFLPFYVLGLVIRREHLALLRTLPARIAGILVLVAAWPISALLADRLGVHWIFWDRSYASMGSATLAGIGIRALLIVLAVLTSAAILALTPPGRSWMTAFGMGSLYGYLLHGFAAWAFKWTPVHEWFHGAFREGLFLAGCVALTAALCSPPVQRVLRPLVEPRTDWLLLPRDGAQASRR